MKKKSVLASALALVLSLSLAACGTSSTSSSGSSSADSSSAASSQGNAKPKQLVAQIGPNPETIDPALNTTMDGGNMLVFAYDCLLTVDQDEKIIPGVAEKWEASEDGLKWTFHLRKDLKWSDGTALNANDFVYSWKRVADPATAAPYGETVLGMVKGFDEASKGNLDALGVSAPDDSTFVVELAHPCGYFEWLAAFPVLSPVNQATIEKNGDAWATAPESFISNGPFMITEWVPDSYILFSKNPNYWNKEAIKLDSIKLLLIEDGNAAFNSYNSGEADMIYTLPSSEIGPLKESGRADFHADAGLSINYVSLNTSLPEFSDVKVRQALSLAIDRKHLTDTLMSGTNIATGNFIGSGVMDFDGTAFKSNANGGKPYIDVDDVEGNLAKAKQLLADAGYPEGKGFPPISYMTNDASYNKVVAQYVQQAWQNLGLTVNVDIVEWATFSAQRRAGDYIAARNGWGYDYPDASNVLELFKSTNGNNDGKYNNPAYDELIDKAAAEVDGATRSGYLHQAEDILMADAAAIPLADKLYTYLQSDKITGSWFSPRGYWYFQYADIAE